MPLQILPLDLPGEAMTEIMEQTVKELLEEIEEGSRLIFNDGIFPGTKQLSGPERLGQYLENTDPRDYEKLFDDEYLARLMAGMEAPPVSPYWLNQLSLRSSYERNRRDFNRLIMDQGTRIRGTRG